MTTPNPACTVNTGATPVDVAASSTITIALASTTGVRYWAVSCTSTDELNTPAAVNATLSINQTNKTATCSLSSQLGSAYIFTSIVGINGLGLDANSTIQPLFTTTFKVNVLAAGGARVLAKNETFEQLASDGWIAVINPVLRSGTSSVPLPVTPANGGTGLTSLPANDLLVGNGTSVVTGLAPGTAGNIPISDGTHWTSAPNPGSSIGAPGATISSNTTIAASSAAIIWIVITGNVGGYTLTAPNLAVGQQLMVTFVGPTLIDSTNGITISAGGAGYTFENPEDRSIAPATTQTMFTSYQNWIWTLDGTHSVARARLA